MSILFTSSIYSSLISFKCITSFISTSCYFMHRVQWYSATVSIFIFRTVCLALKNHMFCSSLQKNTFFQSLPSLISYSSLHREGWELMRFPCSLWHVHCCHSCSAQIGVVFWWGFTGVASDTTRRQNLKGNFPDSLTTIKFLFILDPEPYDHACVIDISIRAVRKERDKKLTEKIDPKDPNALE